MRRAFVLMLFVACGAQAAPTAAPRFSAQATATLQADAPLQSGAGMRLRAGLARKNVAASSLQSGGPYLVSADLLAAATACYSDTIFRDDFDSDGF